MTCALPESWRAAAALACASCMRALWRASSVSLYLSTQPAPAHEPHPGRLTKARILGASASECSCHAITQQTNRARTRTNVSPFFCVEFLRNIRRCKPKGLVKLLRKNVRLEGCERMATTLTKIFREKGFSRESFLDVCLCLVIRLLPNKLSSRRGLQNSGR
jgi:hypothetical protein